MRSEQVIDSNAEYFAQLLQHIGVGKGFSPFPLGDGLVGVVQFFSQLQLCHTRLGAQVDYVAGRYYFQVLHWSTPPKEVI